MTPQFTAMQTMATLAFIADAGALIDKGDCAAEQELSLTIGNYLETLEPVRGCWELVWGPCVYKFPVIAKFTDNTVLVVQNKQDPSWYVIAISGSNPYEITNWIFEDLLVGQTVAWAYGNPPPGASISTSAGISLSILQHLRPCHGVKGENLRLVDFFEKTPGLASLTVTGHSLGGEMAATAALWLADTQGDLWDAQEQARVSAYSFAAPTAGNASWAGYFHRRLGDNAHRIWNSLDVVAHAWQLSDLNRIPHLYEPQIKAPLELKVALTAILLMVENKDYEQVPAVAADRQPLIGSVNPDPLWAKFASQIEYQHVDAYIEMLQLPEVKVLIDFLRDTRPHKKG